MESIVIRSVSKDILSIEQDKLSGSRLKAKRLIRFLW